MSFRSFFALLLLLLCVSAGESSAQNPSKDSLQLPMIYPSYSINLPFGDMKDRFGYSHTIGAGCSYLFMNRWMLSLEGNFLFGNQIKDRASVLAGILTSDGHVISEEGTYANMALTQRGYTIWLKAGRLFPAGKVNPNTGFLFMAGAGMMQHKIRIDVSQNNTPQLRDDYKKGYDRMCNGPAITEFLGYQYLDGNKRLNFYAGIELTQAWTQSRRAYYFADRLRPDEKRFDMLAGIKVGWLVPLFRKSGREYYYY